MNLIPDDAPAIVSFSGGRSSGYMVKLLKDGGYLDRPDVHVVFCNTGKERAETYDFIHEVGKRWGVNVVWLEYQRNFDAGGGKPGDYKVVHKVVDYETASRSGKPFEDMVAGKFMLPNPVRRVCTYEMKIMTVWRWARREMGLDGWYSVLGIRVDEERRLMRMQRGDVSRRDGRRQEIARVFPLVVAGVDKAKVSEFWAGNDFDLGIPSWQGNCDLCFMKGKRNLLATMRLRPDLAKWWIRMENAMLSNHGGKGGGKMRNQKMAQFNRDYKMSELLADAQAQTEIAGLDGEGGIDCFCGD